MSRQGGRRRRRAASQEGATRAADPKPRRAGRHGPRGNGRRSAGARLLFRRLRSRVVAPMGLKNVNVPRHADDRKTADAFQRTHEAVAQLGTMAGEYSVDVPINDGAGELEIRPPSIGTQQDNYNP